MATPLTIDDITPEQARNFLDMVTRPENRDLFLDKVRQASEYAELMDQYAKHWDSVGLDIRLNFDYAEQMLVHWQAGFTAGVIALMDSVAPAIKKGYPQPEPPVNVMPGDDADVQPS